MTANSPPKIVFVDHTARLGGGEIALANLVEELARREPRPVQIHVILFEEGPLADRLRKVDGVGLDVIPLADAIHGFKKDKVGAGAVRQLPAVIGFARRLAARLKELDADVVYCNSLKADIIGGLAGRLAGRAVVWHVRDRVEPDYLPRKVVPLFRRLARWIPHGIAANSHHTLETVRLPEKGVPRAVIYSGVNPPAEVAPEPDGPPVLGLVGRLAPWKGQHVFLDAAAVVRKSFPDAKFRLIGAQLFGEDEYADQLRARSEQPDLAGGVEFCGFTNDVWGALSELTLVIHASTVPEPFGQVVVEGMAAERAVIATDGGGVRETVIDGETGVRVPMGDDALMAREMSGAIVGLLSDPQRRRSMAKAGRERAIGQFHIR